jgi:hypothetical protein
VGPGKTAVLVVDDFLENAEELRAFALQLGYLPPKGDVYPGLKAFASLAGGSEIAQWIANKLVSRLNLRCRYPGEFSLDRLRAGCIFAVLSCDPSWRPPNYTDVHVDNTAWLASVLHLSLHNEARATAFWQHRNTGLQSWYVADPVQLARLESLLDCNFANQFTNAVRQTPQQSVDSFRKSVFEPNPHRRLFSLEEDDQRKLIGAIPAKFNRLVVYPTWQIHSIVDMTTFESLSIDTMRLTMNQFVELPLASLSPDKTSGPTFSQKFYRTVEGLRCKG